MRRPGSCCVFSAVLPDAHQFAELAVEGPVRTLPARFRIDAAPRSSPATPHGRSVRLTRLISLLGSKVLKMQPEPFDFVENGLLGQVRGGFIRGGHPQVERGADDVVVMEVELCLAVLARAGGDGPTPRRTS